MKKLIPSCVLVLVAFMFISVFSAMSASAISPADITIKDIRVSDVWPDKNENISVHVEIWNGGPNLYKGRLEVELYFYAYGISSTPTRVDNVSLDYRTAVLSAGATAWADMSLIIPNYSDIRDCALTAKVSLFDYWSGDDNLSNNVYTTYIVADKKPILKTTGISYEGFPELKTYYGPSPANVTFIAGITNIGNYRFEDPTAGAAYGWPNEGSKPRGGPAEVMAQYFVDGAPLGNGTASIVLEPNAAYNFTTVGGGASDNLSLINKSGSFNVSVMVSPHGDGIKTITFHVKSADVIANTTLNDGTWLLPGDTLDFDISIHNIGDARAGGENSAYANALFSWRVYYNDGADHLLKSDQSSLGPGESLTARISWNTSGLSPGQYIIKIIADSDNDVRESNESNNVKTVAVSIKATTTIIAFEDLALQPAVSQEYDASKSMYANISVEITGTGYAFNDATGKYIAITFPDGKTTSWLPLKSAAYKTYREEGWLFPRKVPVWHNENLFYYNTYGGVILNQVGMYRFEIFANTTADAWASLSSAFWLNDTTAPVISNLLATPAKVGVGKSTVISATIVENNALANATIVITDPLGGKSYPVSMIHKSGSAYSVDTLNEVPLTLLGVYTYTIYATDCAGNTATASSNFSAVDTEAPVIVNVTTSPGTQESNGPVKISARVTDNLAALDTVTLSVWYANNNTLVLSTALPPVGDGTYSYSKVYKTQGLYKYQISATDKSGNTQQSAYQYFTVVADMPPRFLNVMPEPNGYGKLKPTISFDVVDYSQRVNDSSIQFRINGVPITTFTATSTENGSVFHVEYTPSGVYTNGETIKVKVSASDNYGNTNTTTWNFIVDAEKPSITLKALENNSAFPSGTPIDFIIKDNFRIREINYSRNGEPRQAFSTYTSVLSIYTINTVGWHEGKYVIDVIAVDFAGNVNQKQYLFTINETVSSPDIQPPVSRIIELPAYSSSTSFVLSWTGYDNNFVTGVVSGLKWYSVEYRDGENGSWTPVPGATETNATSVTFTGLDGHTYYFRSQARDMAGNLEQSHEEPDTYTTIDVTSPTLLSKSVDKMTVLSDEEITIKVSIADQNLESVSAVIMKGGDELRTISLIHDYGDVYVGTYTPSSSGDYSIDIIAADAAGNTLEQSGALHFTVKAFDPGSFITEHWILSSLLVLIIAFGAYIMRKSKKVNV